MSAFSKHAYLYLHAANQWIGCADDTLFNPEEAFRA